jgi:hypothetical protein
MPREKIGQQLKRPHVVSIRHFTSMRARGVSFYCRCTANERRTFAQLPTVIVAARVRHLLFVQCSSILATFTLLQPPNLANCATFLFCRHQQPLMPASQRSTYSTGASAKESTVDGGGDAMPEKYLDAHTRAVAEALQRHEFARRKVLDRQAYIWSRKIAKFDESIHGKDIEGEVANLLVPKTEARIELKGRKFTNKQPTKEEEEAEVQRRRDEFSSWLGEYSNRTYPQMKTAIVKHDELCAELEELEDAQLAVVEM